MKKEYLDALTYLSSFDDGLSHYKWDRALTYKLKYGIHPGEFIKFFIDEGLIENTIAVSKSNYKLSSSGITKVAENKKELKSLEDAILQSISICKSRGWEIEVEERLPLFQISYLGTLIRIWIKRNENADHIICHFPSETEIRTNEISLSKSMLEKTEILSDLLETHFKYLAAIKN